MLKRRVQPGSRTFEQSIKRIFDIREVFQHNPANKFVFSKKSPDNCASLDDGRIVMISSVDGNYISGTVLEFCRNLYSHPYPSKVFRMGYYSLSRLRVKNVLPVGKCIVFYKDSEYLVIPLP